MKNIVTQVEKNSIAEELGIEPGDILLSINEQEINDVFDYRYLVQDEELTIVFETIQGEKVEIELEKDAEEDLGLVFQTGLMDISKNCQNKCIFCFIDQLPKNMREPLYFKDDDSRLSFLSGNYVTLTNMSDAELEKIIFYHLSPINISVHTTDSNLRQKMLNNKKAGNIINQIKKLANNNISLNFQIVLCRNINDGKALDKTIDDLSMFIPLAKSLSVVPIGMTKERKKNDLCSIEPFNKQSSIQVIEQIHSWQKRLRERFDTAFVFAADEFYLLAELPFPRLSEYEGFPQLENGVGMVRLIEEEFNDYLAAIPKMSLNKIISVATGAAAYDLICDLTKQLSKKVKGITINVFRIENYFFGKQITVSGLLTGTDIINQLRSEKKNLGETLFIPKNALKADEPIFLDDISIEDLERELGISIVAVETTGIDFINKILNR